ncbi:MULTISPECIES: hypothetical protein [unclassified Cytobacillus]|uniref:hypothetical protein n=1 Tax=unclassified Cytobacillus TaxID=2675268 RepID=UPI001359486A|nr:hypothetical protein [Cytobacillus sp. AMY 15.2]KAF0820797.1 hypothetical protein KIS4809_0324 [Bacillus sp. ZZV12-4809]MCM3093424.1 hypothetical protein [Cytobacillus sp. AMY 15.2]
MLKNIITRKRSAAKRKKSLNITAARNAQAILNSTVPAKDALLSIKAAPAENAHLKFIIAAVKNAHLNGMTAAVKSVSIAFTINPEKQRPALLTAFIIFQPHILRTASDINSSRIPGQLLQPHSFSAEILEKQHH